MSQQGSGTAGVIEKIREFDRIASMLDIPRAERLGILNLSDELYKALCAGKLEQNQRIRPELERRLSYSLPLMRRLAGNSPLTRAPGGFGGMRMCA